MPLLEIEHKFAFTAPQLARALANKGRPPFTRHEVLASRRFEDIYYDDASSSLARAGLWLRRRDGLWGAKIRRGLQASGPEKERDEFARTTFEETANVARIGELVRQARGAGTGSAAGMTMKGGMESDLARAFGLCETARIVTARRAIRVDKRFHVVFDSCTFYWPHRSGDGGPAVEGAESIGTHEVGEVEVEVTLDGSGNSCVGEEAARVHAEIAACMDLYAWLFRADGSGGVQPAAVGKLSAYFEWLKSRGGQM